MGFSPALWAFSGGYIIACGAAQAVLGGVTQRSIAITWFERYRGRAMGLVSMALPLGAAMLAVGGQWLLQSGWSWHEVFYGLAALAIVVVLVPVALVLRHSPEAMGLFPDGPMLLSTKLVTRSGSLTGRVNRSGRLAMRLRLGA